jgi:hypothetical protein
VFAVKVINAGISVAVVVTANDDGDDCSVCGRIRDILRRHVVSVVVRTYGIITVAYTPMPARSADHTPMTTANKLQKHIAAVVSHECQCH